MPLKHGTSEKTREENIKREIHAGKPVKQAVAIGYSEQRESKKHKHHAEHERGMREDYGHSHKK